MSRDDYRLVMLSEKSDADPRPRGEIEWQYRCQKCGFTTASKDPDLTTCNAPFLNGRIARAEDGEPCGGEFTEESPWAPHDWQIRKVLADLAWYKEDADRLAAAVRRIPNSWRYESDADALAQHDAGPPTA